MELTTKGLKKFAQTDTFNVEEFNNYNMQAIDDMLSLERELTIPTTGWTSATDAGGKTYYYQSFNVTGLRADDTPIVAVKVGATIDVTAYTNASKNFAYFMGYDCASGSITFYTTKEPTSQFVVTLKGV